MFKLLLLIRANDCSGSQIHKNIYRLINCRFLSMGLSNFLTPNILHQIRGAAHSVILNQGFLIKLQYPRTRDRYQLHNVLKKSIELILGIKALPLRQNYNVNPSLKPLQTYLLHTKNHFLRKDTSAKRLYLEHSHIVNT